MHRIEFNIYLESASVSGFPQIPKYLWTSALQNSQVALKITLEFILTFLNPFKQALTECDAFLNARSSSVQVTRY